jgi:hypothetical protein
MKSAAEQHANELDRDAFVCWRDLDALPQHVNAIVTLRRQDEA